MTDNRWPAPDLHILQHALGLDRYGRGRSYRNHFCADGKDVDTCRDLVARGLMTEHPASEITGGDPLFTVTEAGRRYVCEHRLDPPKLTRSQRRYREFLAHDFGMSFREWLISEKERRA